MPQINRKYKKKSQLKMRPLMKVKQKKTTHVSKHQYHQHLQVVVRETFK